MQRALYTSSHPNTIPYSGTIGEAYRSHAGYIFFPDVALDGDPENVCFYVEEFELEMLDWSAFSRMRQAAKPEPTTDPERSNSASKT